MKELLVNQFLWLRYLFFRRHFQDVVSQSRYLQDIPDFCLSWFLYCVLHLVHQLLRVLSTEGSFQYTQKVFLGHIWSSLEKPPCVRPCFHRTDHSCTDFCRRVPQTLPFIHLVHQVIVIQTTLSTSWHVDFELSKFDSLQIDLRIRR